jgi:hypothetical protein
LPLFIPTLGLHSATLCSHFGHTGHTVPHCQKNATHSVEFWLYAHTFPHVWHTLVTLGTLLALARQEHALRRPVSAAAQPSSVIPGRCPSGTMMEDCAFSREEAEVLMTYTHTGMSRDEGDHLLRWARNQAYRSNRIRFGWQVQKLLDPGAGNQAQEFRKGGSSQDQQPGLPGGQHPEGKRGAGGRGGPGGARRCQRCAQCDQSVPNVLESVGIKPKFHTMGCIFLAVWHSVGPVWPVWPKCVQSVAECGQSVGMLRGMLIPLKPCPHSGHTQPHFVHTLLTFGPHHPHFGHITCKVWVSNTFFWPTHTGHTHEALCTLRAHLLHTQGALCTLHTQGALVGFLTAPPFGRAPLA